MTETRWDLLVAGPAKRTLDRLPEKLVVAVLDFMLGPLCENPLRVGKRLRGDFARLHSARVGVYRVLYEINDDLRTVTILYVDHRADVYRRR